MNENGLYPDEQRMADLVAEVERLKAENAKLQENADLYLALRRVGVDNWSGWDDAMDLFHNLEGRGE